MSVPKQCCNPCPSVLVTEIPGVEGAPGADGTNGTNGINASTITTAPGFVVPLNNGADPVTIIVGNSSWAVPGEKIFIEGAGYFECVSKPTGTSMVLVYLDYVGNTNTGNTISAGAGVSPGGNQGPNATLLPGISMYVLGGSQALTNSSLPLLGLSITLTTGGSYLIMATCRLDLDVATFEAAREVTLKLRETNNGPADLPNAIAGANTGLTTLDSRTFETFVIPPTIYVAAAGDVVELYGIVAIATPYSGALNAVEGSILAIPLF